MTEPTKKQEKVLREFLSEAVVPLIEDVLVKKLGQAMSYAKEQYKESKREWVGLTDDEKLSAIWTDGSFNSGAEWAEAKLKEKNT